MLIGGGHSHVQVLTRHRMRPYAARLTIVVDRPLAVYSGMVPGFVAGNYQPRELEIDIWTLGHACGARVLVAPAVRIDTSRGRVELEGRPSIPYDAASIDIGSTVAGLDLPGVREHALATRPIGRFVADLDRRLEGLVKPRIVVVGGGAGGVELAFCLEARTGGQVTLVDGAERVVRGMRPGVARRVEAAAKRRGITLVAGARAACAEGSKLFLQGGDTLPFDLLVWAAGAAAHPFGRDSGLPVDERGFIRVGADLRVEGFGNLYAVGDCAAFGPRPLPKAGVYAVRQGPVLANNLGDGDTRRYRPQADFLALLNLGDGTAIGSRSGIVFEGAWAMRWKDRIDRTFMRKFQPLAPDDTPAFAPMEDEAMECGGCAAKVGQAELQAALGQLPPREDPSVELGLDRPDDAAVVRTTRGERIALTVDGFTAFVDDPWLVGKVAAINAVSDLHVKRLRPRWAFALVGVQGAEELHQVMAGLRSVLDARGISLVGGHTLRTDKLQVGLTLVGEAPGEVPTLDAMQVGDTLILTRALGTGVLFRADALGRARGAWVLAALAAMERTPPALPEVHAATDITGFGLAGHLGAMAAASDVTAEVSLAALPVLDGVEILLAQGVRSTVHEQNRAVVGVVDVPEAPRAALLFDPQTAGPMLLSVADPGPVLAALRASGVSPSIIGRVLPRAGDARIRVVP